MKLSLRRFAATMLCVALMTSGLAAAPGKGPGAGSGSSGGASGGASGGESGGGATQEGPAEKSSPGAAKESPGAAESQRKGSGGTEGGAGAKDELSSWLATPAGRNYGSLKESLEDYGRRAAAAGIPASLLRARLEEGASKAVPPARLGAAIGEDLGRYLEIGGLLANAEDFPADEARRAALLQSGGLLLRAGIQAGELAASLAATPKRLLEARGSRAERAFAASGASLELASRFSLSVAQRARLAAAMSRSALGQRDFGELAARFAAAVAAGGNPVRVAELVAGLLEGGATLATLDRELAARLRAP